MRNLQLMNYRPKDHIDQQKGVHVNGEFVLVTPPLWGERLMIGNYLEVILHRKLGVVNQIKRPDGEMQDVRGYEFVIHHSAFHGDGPYEKVLPPEMVRYTASSTVDAMLRDQEDGAQLALRPVKVQKHLGPNNQNYRWYVIAVDGVYKSPSGGVDFVPHSSLLEK